MQVKEGEAAHALKEAARHVVNEENKREIQEWFAKNAAAADMPEPDVLEQEIISYWDNPELKELVNSEEFCQQLKKICQKLVFRFKASTICSCEDLEQVVIARFGKWYPSFRGDSKPKTALYRIARNALVDLSRSPDKRCDSLESMNLAEMYLVATHQNVAAIQYNVLVKQLWRKLTTRKERDLFFARFVEWKTPSEIGRERGVSRQAISKQLDRIVEKLQRYL